MNEFEDLLDRYFQIGVREGAEGRNHDDIHRSAELTREKIRACFADARKVHASLSPDPKTETTPADRILCDHCTFGKVTDKYGDEVDCENCGGSALAKGATPSPNSQMRGGEPTPSRPEASSTTTGALPLSYGSPMAGLAESPASVTPMRRIGQ